MNPTSDKIIYFIKFLIIVNCHMKQLFFFCKNEQFGSSASKQKQRMHQCCFSLFKDDFMWKVVKKCNNLTNQNMGQCSSSPPSNPSNSKTVLFHEFEGEGFSLAQFKTPELAIFSYLIESNGQACLVDPTYELYPYHEFAEKKGTKITSIFLTHYHADYVAGHTELNVPIIMGPKSRREGAIVKATEMEDGSLFRVGSIEFKILHTPGHTLESSCFLLIGKDKKQSCLLTGDTVFLGEVGRPDLAVSSACTSQDLAKMLFASLNKIKKEVEPAVRIYPTHGSGSSCGKNISDGNFCSLENQLAKNYAFKIESEKEFVEKILEGMPKPPSYFFHDAKLNQTGKTNRFEQLLKQCAKALSVEEFAAEAAKGCTIIDSRHEFGGKTIKNSLMMSENGFFANWVGEFISPQTNLLLICDKDKVNDIIERLLRIGYFNIKGYNEFTIDEWQEKGKQIWEPKMVSAKEAVEGCNERNHLDVRGPAEWKRDGLIEDATKIPLSEIPTRGSEVKQVQNLYVSCRLGLRARLASSMLAQQGIQSTIVADKFENFKDAGFKIVPYK